MAKNYTMTEVANIFAEKTDFEAMADIGKRYPLLAIKMTALATKAPEETADIFSYMPDYLSANKVNKAIKDGGEDVSDSDVEDDETTEAPAEKPAKKPVAKKEAKAAPKAKADAGSKDYDSMNNKQMYDLLGELGERKACKAEFGDLSKASMTAYLKKHHGDGAVEAEDEAEEETGKYDGKKAPELYALCKKRGIKAEPKKPAKYYVGLLEKADAEEAEEEPEDDDWGDEAEVEEDEAEPDTDDEDDDEWKEPEEKPKKKAGRPKKAAAKPVAKKAAKKVEESDDDDDDWDI